MSPDDLGARVAAGVAGATAEVAFGQVTVDVPVAGWVGAGRLVHDDPALACTYFDWLSAYDATAADDPERRLGVVAHVWSNAHRHHLRLRTTVTGDPPRLPTLSGVWSGANWHERETFEMFGAVFDGHPNLVPLLLPDGFEGHPLRKEFVLASRAAKPWPGAKEPGESDHDVRAAPTGRRRMLPPGVPAPGEWGPAAPEEGA